VSTYFVNEYVDMDMDMDMDMSPTALGAKCRRENARFSANIWL